MLKRIAWGILLPAALAMAWADESLSEQLFTAVVENDKAAVEALIARGAEVNAEVRNTGVTLLAFVKSKDMAELLIAKGADVNATHKGGYTPLFSLIASHCSDVERLPRISDAKERLWREAMLRDTRDVVELLISKGADVNAKAENGHTPIEIAVLSNDRDMVELLIAKGAEVNEHVLQTAGVQRIEGSEIKPEIKTMVQAAFNNRPTANQLETFKKLMTEFKADRNNDVLRASIIGLALKQRPGPVIPREAQAAAGRAAYIFKNAKSVDDILSAAKEYLTAIEMAPWVANFYFNLCTVLEKTPYSQQALHACKLYLAAAPNAPDAADMQQRIAGLQYAADRDKAQMRQRTAQIKHLGLEDLYRYGGMSAKISGKDIAVKLMVDWYSAPPKYQIYVACFQSGQVYGDIHDLVSTDSWIDLCLPVVNMHLAIKPEGEGFIELSDTSGGSFRTTFNELFRVKQTTMTNAVMFHTIGDDGERYYLPYVQGGEDLKHRGWVMYESDCKGNLLKQDPRALPDDFISSEAIKNGGLGRFSPEMDDLKPNADVCAREFSSKTGYRFGAEE